MYQREKRLEAFIRDMYKTREKREEAREEYKRHIPKREETREKRLATFIRDCI